MTSIYQLKIENEGSQPSWRRIQLAADTIFSEFHDVIQIVFQAEYNSEEYEFSINKVRIFDFGAEIDTGKNPELKDSNETFLDEYVNLAGMHFTYTCDSDDQLKFSIILEKIETDAENIDPPRCIDGDGPSLSFDPAHFDLEEVNKELMQYKEAWEELYDETEKIIGNELYEDEEDEDDLWSEEEGEPEDINDYYECVKNFRQPEDLIKNDLEKSDLEHWLEDNLYDNKSLEFETHQRLINEGYPEKEAKNLLLECLAIEWFSKIKYGTEHLDERYTYSLNLLPAKPLEIPNLDYALQVLETATKGLPFQAIEYLHDHASPEATSAIVNALNNHSDHQYCWGNCQFAPIWYAIAAEGHLQEVMIDPVIDLCKKNNNETDWLLEQAEFLIGKLAMNYPELTAAKVLDALEKDAEERTDHNLFFLFDCFYFCDLALHKERLIALLKHTNVCWHESLISTLSLLQVKEALPIIKQRMAELQASDPSGYYIEFKEAIQQLETGEIKYPEVSMPICLKRENSWREEYEPYEEKFYPDDDDAFYDALENGFDMPWNKQEPVVVGAKVGRNDPCPCGSGKKYKKCCLGKDGV